MAKKIPDVETLSEDVQKISLKNDSKGKEAKWSKEITVVTWNIKNRTIKGESSDGYADMRRELIKCFTDRNPGYLYCIQEARGVFDKGFCYLHQEKIGTDVNGAIVFQKGMKHTKPPIKGETKCTYDDVNNCRFYGVQFFIKEDDITHSFTLVSYHGHHSGMSNENKMAKIKEFFSKMLEVAKIHKMTVIIGGDFNLSVEDWKEEVEKLCVGRIKVANAYEPGESRKLHGKSVIIDTFAVVYPPEDIPHTCCELDTPVPVNQEEAVKDIKVKVKVKDKEEELTREKIKELYRMMDHDAITVNVKLTAAKQEPKDPK